MAVNHDVAAFTFAARSCLLRQKRQFLVYFQFCADFLLIYEIKVKYAGKILRQLIGMRWPCNFPFRYMTDKILFTLQVYFDRSLPLKFSEYFSQF